MHEKRELLDLLNEKARKHQDSVSLVAEALGKTAEVKDTCDVSFAILFMVSIIHSLHIVQYYSVYDLVKDVPERDFVDDITSDESDSDTDEPHDFGDSKVLWENMPVEHKAIVKEMFDKVNDQVAKAKYAEKYNIPLGKTLF